MRSQFVLLTFCLCTGLIGSAAIFLAGTAPAAAQPGTHVSGSIVTDTTWTTAGSPYLITGDITVNPGITLTIQAGVQVRFQGNYALVVRGTLNATGDDTSPILFTSDQTSPQPGDWGVLDFRSSSRNSVLRHAVVEYGGSLERYGEWCASGAICVRTSSFVMNYVTVQHNATRGLVLVQSSARITNNQFNYQPEEAIRLGGCSPASEVCRPEIRGNTFTGNDSAIRQAAPFDPILGDNQASGNRVNGVLFELPCNFTGPSTWYSDLPYVIPAGGNYCGLSSSQLTIQPGTVIKLEGGLQFGSNTAVTATGTAEQPILFTSFKDDSAGGDTNNDGSASTPAAGDWSVVLLNASTTRALFEHAIFRYGGASDAFSGLLRLNGGSSAVVRSSKLSDSRNGGLYINLYGRGVLEDSLVENNGQNGVDIYTAEAVTITRSQIQGNGNGIFIYRGSPQVSETRFENNQAAVYSTCAGCVPVISPHNYFAGSGAQAIVNTRPMETCINARRNWWADLNGPQDSSKAADACGLLDNQSPGALVSDGVDYTLWDGGTPRPVIAHPLCGVNGLSQPEFSGRALSGSAVRFYDSSALLGQVTAGSDDAFHFTPTTPLSDGLHRISAVASLDGVDSLPSTPLTLTVASWLPYDPGSITISYGYHSATFVQYLRDSTGCAALTGDFDLPIYVRPGSVVTVALDMKTSAIPAARLPVFGLAPTPRSTWAGPPAVRTRLPHRLVTVINSTHQDLVRIGAAGLLNQDSSGEVYGPFAQVNTPGPLYEERTGYYNLPDGKVILNFGKDSRTVYDQVSINESENYAVLKYPRFPLTKVTILNETSNDIQSLYLPISSTIDQWGGSYLSATQPLTHGTSMSLSLPFIGSSFNVVLRDSAGTFYLRQLPDTEEHPPIRLSGASVPLEITNKLGKPICEVRIAPFDTNTMNYFGKPLRTRPVNLLTLLQRQITPDEIYAINLEAPPEGHEASWNKYYVIVRGCDPGDKPIIYPLVDPHKPLIVTPCDSVGSAKLGTENRPFDCPGYLAANRGADTECTRCLAVLNFQAGDLNAQLCGGDDPGQVQMSFRGGAVTTDPDGFVYNAAIGLEARIPGATVTCDLYDAEMKTWQRWPAELFNDQVNPQVTWEDGYYSFFVPPGTYRVSASAPGYQPYTSPDIHVASEVVHHNIPLQGSGWIFLPLVNNH